MNTLYDFPSPSSVIVGSGRHRLYKTPEGSFPSVTTVLKAYGGGKDALVSWSAREERKAILEACADVYAMDESPAGPSEFAAAVESRIGHAKAHQRLMDKAADIGTAAHQRVQWQVQNELGVPCGPEPSLPEGSLWAWMAFDSFWKDSGLKPVRSEQPIWHAGMGYAGTIDLIAQDTLGTYGGGLGVIDLKTSRGIYDSHHLQVSAYLHAARQWAPVEWALLLRLPKTVEDPNFEVKMLGDLTYDYTKDGKRIAGGKKVQQADLLRAFSGVLEAYKVLFAEAA